MRVAGDAPSFAQAAGMDQVPAGNGARPGQRGPSGKQDTARGPAAASTSARAWPFQDKQPGRPFVEQAAEQAWARGTAGYGGDESRGHPGSGGKRRDGGWLHGEMRGDRMGPL
jgi:hypothetical protein